MANFHTQTRTVRYLEWLVPTGDPIAELDKALAAAEVAWRQANPDREPFGDWCTVHAHDEHVLIRVEIQEVKPC